MKIKINNKKLLTILNHIETVIEKRAINDILNNVKIIIKNSIMSLSAINSEMFIQESIKIFSIDQINTAVPINILYKIIKKIKLNEDIILSFEPVYKPTQMFIYTLSNKFMLPCLPAKFFSNFKRDSYNCTFQISSKKYIIFLLAQNMQFLLTKVNII